MYNRLQDNQARHGRLSKVRVATTSGKNEPLGAVPSNDSPAGEKRQTKRDQTSPSAVQMF